MQQCRNPYWELSQSTSMPGKTIVDQPSITQEQKLNLCSMLQHSVPLFELCFIKFVVCPLCVIFLPCFVVWRSLSQVEK